MDNDTLNNQAQTNTTTGAPASTPPTPPASPANDAPSTPPESPSPEPVALEPTTPDLEPVSTASAAPTSSPDTTVPPLATDDSSTPVTPPLDDTPSTGGALDTSAPLVDSAPILGTTPETKMSPILNSAPAKTNKLDLKYIIPIAVLGVAVLGLGGFLLYDKLVAQPAALDNARKTASTYAAPAVTNDVSVSTGSDSSTSSPLLMTYSSSNSIGGNGTYILSANGPQGVTVTSNEASTVAEFTINWAEAKTVYSDLKTSTGTTKYTVTPGQNVTEIFYGQIGENNYYLILLEDGTIDFLDIHQALLDKNFKAAPVNQAENVIKFLTSTTDGSPTILAQTSEGTYYDLSTILN